MTTIETITHSVNSEPFPAIVFCSKHSVGYYDKFGLVKVAFDMIEFVCIEKKNTSDQCEKYLEKRSVSDIMKKPFNPFMPLMAITSTLNLPIKKYTP